MYEHLSLSSFLTGMRVNEWISGSGTDNFLANFSSCLKSNSDIKFLGTAKLSTLTFKLVFSVEERSLWCSAFSSPEILLYTSGSYV